MAETYISTHHQSPDQPSAAVSGVSLTVRMPINSSDRVRIVMCPRARQAGSPFVIRPPIAEGMDMPTMNRNAGKTKSYERHPATTAVTLTEMHHPVGHDLARAS